jgi:pimeloyl-ACP methyl ester carboxylesterase
MEKFIMADGCAVRVRDGGGEGPVLVLLHGYLESIELWDEFIPLLTGLRAVAVDLPGHGISEVKGPVHTMEFLARTVRAALAELGIAQAFIAGHSMGGYVALEFLRMFPEACEGIALLHSTPNADTEEKKEQRLRETALIEAGKKELIARRAASAKFAPENRRRLAGKIDELCEMAFMEDDEGIKALLRGMIERRDNNPMLRESGVRQLFVFGYWDEYIPLETARSIADSHPQALAVWLEHSGHMGFIEEPAACAAALSEFIR